MKSIQVQKFGNFEKVGMLQECCGYIFECTKVDKEEGKKRNSAPLIYGTLTAPDGSRVVYEGSKYTFASALNKYLLSKGVKIECGRTRSSDESGAHKIISVSKRKKSQVNEEDIRSMSYSRIDQLRELINRSEREISLLLTFASKKASAFFTNLEEEEAAAKKAAEEAAKRAAEEAAAKAAEEAKAAAEREAAIITLMKYAKMTREQAEASVDA